MQLPTRKEINVHDSLDERKACRNFLGKTLDEAEALFRQNALGYSDDMHWMGVVAFRFYVFAYCRYVQSHAAGGDSDGVSCFVGFMEHRIKHERSELKPISKELIAALRHIIDNYDRFDLRHDVYGDLRPRCEEQMKELLQGD